MSPNRRAVNHVEQKISNPTARILGPHCLSIDSVNEDNNKEDFMKKVYQFMNFSS